MALTELAILVVLGLALAAIVAIVLPHHRYFSEFKSVAIFAGAALLVFGGLGAGGLPVGMRVLENTRRLPGLKVINVLPDQPTMTVSPTALLLASGLIVVVLGILL